MPSQKEQQRRQTVAFWLMVLLICAIAGVLSYQLGKNWVGRRLAEVDLEAGTRPEAPPAAVAPAIAASPDEPEVPLQPEVEIEERAPSETEKLTAERPSEEEAPGAEPQNGAELHATEAPADDQQPQPPAAEWVVTAGSFSNLGNAHRQVERLKERGYNPFITEIEKEGISYHRVNVATFVSRDDAEQIAQQIREDGFVAGVIHR